MYTYMCICIYVYRYPPLAVLAEPGTLLGNTGNGKLQPELEHTNSQ